MPTKKYRVDTDKGSYEVEVEEPWTAPEGGVLAQGRRSVAESGNEARGENPSSATNRLVRNPMVQGAAHPQSIGDFLGLLLPVEEARALVPSAFKGLKAFREGGFKGVRSWAFGKPQFTQEATGSLWNAQPEAVKAEYLPGGERAREGFFAQRTPKVPENPVTTRTSVPPHVEQTELKDLPLYKQQEMLQGTKGGAARDITTDPMHRQEHFKPVTSESPRPAQGGVTSASTLEDELAQMLDMEKSRLSPEKMTVPGEQTITPGGPTHQSGKFQKSGRVGQAGGYTSGRPGLNQQQYDDLVSRVGKGGQPLEGTGAAQTPQTLEDVLAEDLAAERSTGGEPLGAGGAQATGGNPAASSTPAGVTSTPGGSSAATWPPQEFPDWHSGAQPDKFMPEFGAADTQLGQALHRDVGELNRGYSDAKAADDPIWEALARTLGWKP